LRAANGNYRARSAELKWRRTAGVFGDHRPYAPQQQLEITRVGRTGLQYRQSRVRAD
jgi:hypothetical protein